jgi:formate hydrogenlyase subunit 3/multisubunit Na+/H+ antiporter MnhD subunit
MTTVSLIFVTVFVKFNTYIWNFKNYNQLLSNCQFNQIYLSQLPYTPLVNLNGSLLSDVVILLAFSSGMVCLYLLGEKNISNYLSNLGFFCIYFVAIILMVYTTNLLVMFISFELLFLPTLFFVYSHGYVERADKTLKILLYWTLCGAFLVLVSLAYLYFKYKTLNYFFLNKVPFTV